MLLTSFIFLFLKQLFAHVSYKGFLALSVSKLHLIQGVLGKVALQRLDRLFNLNTSIHCLHRGLLWFILLQPGNLISLKIRCYRLVENFAFNGLKLFVFKSPVFFACSNIYGVLTLFQLVLDIDLTQILKVIDIQSDPSVINTGLVPHRS